MFSSFVIIVTAFGTAVGSGAMAVLLRHIEKNSIIRHYRRKISTIKENIEAEKKVSKNE